MEEFDLVIVGAGWHGITMAKTYLEATADDGDGTTTSKRKILILDEAASIGGCWAKERLYPGLKTNNLVGSYEFSDFPMNLDRYGMQPGQHIPGNIVHRYLVDAATRYGLHDRMRLHTKVTRATLRPDDQKWELDCSYCGPSSSSSPSSSDSSSSSSSSTSHLRGGRLIARKLVVATGVTSEPYMPTFPGQSNYAGNLFHAKNLLERSGDLKTSRKVVVIGGNKSAMDVSYLAAATYGVQEVHLIMRPSGGGPSWMWWPKPRRGMTMMKTTLARLTATRMFNIFDPSPFGEACSGARNLLHHTAPGRVVTRTFWRLLDRCVESSVGYDKDERLSMVRPWASTFWMGNSLCINNYETDWFDLVRSGRVIVHHDVVSSLGGDEEEDDDGSSSKSKSVTLASCSSSDNKDSGIIKEVDTVVCCTGWKSAPTMEFSPPISIGVPSNSTSTGKEEEDGAALLDPKLLSNITETIKRDNPFLSSSSSSSSSLSTPGPYRLYRFMIPPTPSSLRNRNLAFTGLHRSIHAVTVAQAQALWISAFFLSSCPPSPLSSYFSSSSSSSSSSSLPSVNHHHHHHHLSPIPAEVSSPSPSSSSSSSSSSKSVHETILRETLLHTEYERLRRPGASAADAVVGDDDRKRRGKRVAGGGGGGGGGSGDRYPDLVFDSIPYVDLLLQDLGLGWMRKNQKKNKRGGERRGTTTTIKDLWEPYSVRDYEGLVGEWVALGKERGEERKRGGRLVREEMV